MLLQVHQCRVEHIDMQLAKCMYFGRWSSAQAQHMHDQCYGRFVHMPWCAGKQCLGCVMPWCITLMSKYSTAWHQCSSMLLYHAIAMLAVLPCLLLIACNIMHCGHDTLVVKALALAHLHCCVSSMPWCAVPVMPCRAGSNASRW